MLGYLRHGSHEHTHHPKKPSPKATVAEIVPTPVDEITDPIQNQTLPTPQRASIQRQASSSILKKKQSRQSFMGRAIGYVGSALGFSSHAFIREQHTAIKNRCRHELGAEASSRVLDTSYHALLTWIRNERLTRLPQRGSAWDKVLLQAHHFAEQIETLHQLVAELQPDEGAASQLIYGPSLLLLELGHENATALAQAFDAFDQFGLELRPLLRRADLFLASPSIQENLSKAYVDLINIVSGIAIQFHQAAHGLNSHAERSFVKIDIFIAFGAFIDIYHSRIKRCSMEMWSHNLQNAGIGDHRDVTELKGWLAPSDSVLVAFASNNINLAVRSEELTCTWFQSHLNTFLKSEESTMVVEGKTGSGKTVLSNWTIDRLQRPVGRKVVSTINFAFNQNIAGRSTTLAMLKTLLYQLLELRVGDLGVYEPICEAFHEVKHSHDAETQECKLWDALSRALKAIDKQSDETIIVVIDGIDEIQGRARVAEPVSKKLHELAGKCGALRLLQFCQPIENPKYGMRITLDAPRISEDLRAVISFELRRARHFHDCSSDEGEVIVEKIAVAAGTSMLWAHLACAYLTKQDTHQHFDEALKTVLAGPKTVNDITVKLLEATLLTENSKKILSFLVAAERPLLISELQLLLQVDIERQILDVNHNNIADDLRTLKPFLIQRDGHVAIIHADLENALLTIPSASKVSLHLTDRHRDMVVRLMIYAKSCLREHHDPILGNVEHTIIENSFQAHPFLEYAVRYWTLHFKRSTLFKSTGRLDLPAQIVAVFTDSTLFAMFEQLCWSKQYFHSEALEFYSLAYRIRVEAIGEEKACTLQSAITCALGFRAANRITDGIEFYGRCCKISRAIFGAQADFTMQCCDTLLAITETVLVAKRTETMNWHEQTLLIMIEACKHRHGVSSKELLVLYEKLVTFYLLIQEEQKAVEYQKIIRKVTTIIRGEHSVEGGEIDRHLDIVLRKHKREGDIDLFDGSLFKDSTFSADKELSLTLVEIIIQRAATFCDDQEWAKAEELYAELWFRLTTHCRHHNVLEWHLQKIELMLIYSRFLESRKRHTEACSVILSIWTEYEQHEFATTESVVFLLHEVATAMKSLNMLTFALSVYRACWLWFKSSHKEKHELYHKTEEHITRISTEIVQTSKTVSHNERSEAIIREVFESSINSTVEITSTMVELCKSLTSIYIKQERHYEAIQCIKAMMRRSWASFFSASLENITLCSSFTSEHIELVLKMASCHIAEKRYEKTEYCYVRLYRAVRASREINDVLVVKYTELLLEFYKQHEYYHKAISFYQELLVAYRSFYGPSHKLVVQILYELGDLCRTHNRTHGYWIEYYLEIITVLNKGLDVCQESAFKALVIVANCYFEDCRYSESLISFKLILDTFLKHGKKYKFFEDVAEVQLIFEHYFRSLEESKTEISVQLAIIKQYREACLSHFGASALITIHATLLLAETYCRNESFQFESIALYEYVHKHSESTETKTKITRTLTTLYIKKATTETTTITKEMVERSTALAYARYIEIKKTYSCYHEKTLSHFRELILLYHKCTRKEIAIKEMRSLVIEVLSTVDSATVLIETAKILAEIYRICGYVENAHEFIRELKLQIVYKWIDREKTYLCNISKLGRECFAFIAAFECYSRADYSLSFTHYLSALTAEALYYERFCDALNGTSVMNVIICSARLHHTLHHTRHFGVFAELKRKAVEFFIQHETSLIKCSKVAVSALVLVLIEQYKASTSQLSDEDFVAFAGHAALDQIKKLIDQNKHQEALDLTGCTYAYLMAHGGLDDPSEISLGFQMCILMAGKGVAVSHPVQDTNIKQKMLVLSKKVLGEVFDICSKFNINLARLQIDELNDLVSLIGEQKDYRRLLMLLTTVWNTRESQQTWSMETRLRFGMLLVQAEFANDHIHAAIELCGKLMYNCRRVHGIRHPSTLNFITVLRKLYTAQALHYQKANLNAKAKLYHQKAINLNENTLRLLVDPEAGDDSDDDDDLETELAGSANYGDNASVTHNKNDTGDLMLDHDSLLGHVRDHLRHLKLAFQRHGGWHKHSSDYEHLTTKIWREFGEDLKLTESHVQSEKWDASAFGNGKAESEEDVFHLPNTWMILA